MSQIYEFTEEVISLNIKYWMESRDFFMIIYQNHEILWFSKRVS